MLPLSAQLFISHVAADKLTAIVVDVKRVVLILLDAHSGRAAHVFFAFAPAGAINRMDI